MACHIDVIVEMNWSFAPEQRAGELAATVRDHLVDVHVKLRAAPSLRAGLVPFNAEDRSVKCGRYAARLPENCASPETDIDFWKVAKIFHFLATFKVHPWTVLTSHEPMP